MSLFAELKRRNVFRVGIAYIITAWLVAQVLELVLDSFGSPAWVMKTILVLMATGLPFALIFAWAFELTPEGLRRDAEVDHSRSISAHTGRKLDRAIIVVLVLAVAYFFWESRLSQKGSEPFSEVTAQQTARDEPEKRALTPDAAAPASSEQSVAVLPFVSMSPNPAQEYFSDGITEEIINALVKIPRLSVPARTSVFAFKGRHQDVREIGRELNVAHVLEGSIRSQGDQVRITAQLINVASGFHLWSETFDRRLENIFAVQEEIAAAIAQVLVGELGMDARTVPNRTLNMQAYDTYLRGRALLRDRDTRSTEVLKQATREDPGFAPAWAALAISHQVFGYFERNDESQTRAMETARHALTLDPDNVDALTALASALRDTWQWAEAEKYFKAALAIDPQSSELLEDYAEFLCNVGRWDEYLAVSERGYAIEPLLTPLADAYVVALSIFGRFDDALAVIDRFKDERTFYGPTWNLQVLLAAGETERAISLLLGPAAEDFGPGVAAAMVALLQDPGDEGARAVLRAEFAAEAALVYSNVYEGIVHVLVAGGDEAFVLEHLLAKYRTAPWANPEELWQPALAPLRRQPRFGEIVEVLRLPEYWDGTGWPEVCGRNAQAEIECR